MNMATTFTTAVATARGLAAADGTITHLPGSEITAVVLDGPDAWVLVDAQSVRRISGGDVAHIAELPEPAGACLAVHGGALWVGGSRARLWRLDSQRLEQITAFNAAPTSDEWTTPWGGPPDVFSMTSDGTHLYVNVHVGGILRTADGTGWEPTIDLHDDVHHVVADGPGVLWAATGASGLAESRDRGDTWRYHTDGLFSTYAVATAPVPGGAIVSVASGPGQRKGALYRLDADGFHLAEGLPAEQPGAVGPRQLAAVDDRAVAALGGTLYESTDGGYTWSVVVEGLADVSEVALASYR